MAGPGPLTAGGGRRARRASSERYAREWVEQQALAAILASATSTQATTAAATSCRRARRGADDEASLAFVAPVAQLVLACARPLPALTAAYRSGDGLPFADYGEDLIDSQARFTAPMFDRLLAGEWLGRSGPVRKRLDERPARARADVACGEGRSSFAIARGYPKVRVDGIDLDEASIRKAEAHLAGSGLEDRVRFHCRDAADPGLARRLRPRVRLRVAARHVATRRRAAGRCAALLAEGGCVVIGDERVADRFIPRRPATSSASSTAARSRTVCRSAWSARTRRDGHGHARPHRPPRTRAPPASAGSRSCRSRTTSTALYRLVP
jgi:SAM-dependent methyltransferase